LKLKIIYPETADQSLLENFELQVKDAVVQDLCRACPIEWRFSTSSSLNNENYYQLVVKTDDGDQLLGEFGTNYLGKESKDNFRNHLKFLINRILNQTNLAI
jgi:hypothetical protein